MKRFKKFLSVAMVSAMVLAMAGCGNNADAGNQGSGNNTSSGSNAGDSAGVFKIGGIGPTTGGAAIYGINTMNGVQIAVDEINAAGGVNGYKLEINFQDDEHDPEKSINAYNTVKDWGAQMIIGCVTSGPCIAVSELTHEDNMMMLTPSASAVKATQYDNAFQVCFSDPNQGAASAQYIGENKLATKVAVIYDSSDIYSSGIYESFVKGAEEQSFEIVSAEAFTSENKTDFSVQLQKAKDAGADLVFLPIYYQEAALILTQANSMGYAPKWFSCDGMDGILGGVENFDTSLAEGVMLLTPFAADAEDEASKKFTAAYQEAYSETPNQFAADGYDAVYILVEAIKQSNATPSMSVSELGDALKGAMTQITVDGVTGEGMTWVETGEVNKAPRAVVIKDGAYTAM
ncbi:MAG: ABC transporter substrate-binding protein [Clostridium sp.]|nr:ABC transporter substrate-binding protein [Acetatifactor muris]MCM1526529.1 ABC transporter substrate-binding protein [Bacteroides sp.]MCM1562345.1 ABC transporter substrate-binding protein [Clostridium sp.]